jgi:hypothetical protein
MKVAVVETTVWLADNAKVLEEKEIFLLPN